MRKPFLFYVAWAVVIGFLVVLLGAYLFIAGGVVLMAVQAMGAVGAICLFLGLAVIIWAFLYVARSEV